MSDLREALLKAGLTDKNEIDRGRRRRRKQVRATTSVDTCREHGRGAMKPAGEDGNGDDTERIHDIIESGRVKIQKGNRRFFFVDSEGTIPFIETSNEIICGLRSGELAIVEDVMGDRSSFVLVNRETAAILNERRAERIRFWNR